MSNLRKIWNLHRVMKQQWLKTIELEEIQRKMLQSIIKHSYENVPLYHRKFRAADVKPDDIKTVEDLQKIPVTTKQEIKANFPNGILANGVDITKCHVSTTSGSTGEPLLVVYSERDDDYEKAIALRPNLSCGQRIRDKWAVITSPKHVKTKKWFQQLRFFSPEYISVFDNPKEQLSVLEDFKPDVLDGYAASIYLLAKEIKKNNNSVKLCPNLIFTTAEILTDDMRKCIESVFNVEVYDQFGCVELARTAWECPEHTGYHIDMDAVVIEFLRDDEPVVPGERGEIVYTGLYNYSMPFIRYPVSDIGIPSDDVCPCGRGLPLMKVIEGRKDVFMRAPSGKIIAPIIWPVIMERITEIDQYKIIQEKIDLLRVQIVEGKGFTPIIINQIKNDIKNALGEEMFIEIEIVDKIPREAGKVRSVVSRVNIDW